MVVKIVLHLGCLCAKEEGGIYMFYIKEINTHVVIQRKFVITNPTEMNAICLAIMNLCH